MKNEKSLDIGLSKLFSLINISLLNQIYIKSTISFNLIDIR